MKYEIILFPERAAVVIDWMRGKAKRLPTPSTFPAQQLIEITIDNGMDLLNLFHAGIHFANENKYWNTPDQPEESFTDTLSTILQPKENLQP